MTTVRLGKSEITSPKNAFGALPIQRISEEESTKLILKAYENGFTFFDTAHDYTDSEKKLGAALQGIRDKVIIATKTSCKTPEEFWDQLETSLKDLDTEYVDLYQFHNPDSVWKPGDGTGLYEAALEAKAQGKIRHIGITAHKITVAREAVVSGLYETLQFPFSYIASDEEKELVELCKKEDVGFIAMKGLAGGLITNAAAAYAFLDQYDNVLPIWGLQKESELDDFIECAKNPPEFNDEIKAVIEKDCQELTGEFCRGCGYCTPCPVGIEINNCARMSVMIRRAPTSIYFNDEFQAKMQQIKDCTKCGECKKKCPYSLDIPTLLVKNLEDYEIQIAK